MQALEIVQERWREMSRSMHQDPYIPYARLAPLVDVLREHPRIGKLFPYTSHATLRLSRAISNPWSGDCPHVDALSDNLFRVHSSKYVLVVMTFQEYRSREPEYEILGEGALSEAVAWIDAALPPGCGPAIEGSLDDLRRAEGKYAPSEATRALQLAITKGDIAEVRALLESGADVNGKEYGGWTPLMNAARFGGEEILRLLLAHGADVNAGAEDGETALNIAVFYDKFPPITELLKRSGAAE